MAEEREWQRNAKMVIVMRTDLNMRKGKMIAQGAHAALAFLTQHGRTIVYHDDPEKERPNELRVFLTPVQTEWMTGAFTKICVGIDSEQGLLDIAEQAKEAGLTVSLIEDMGFTEFGGKKTVTCCAIGPDWIGKIDEITKDLSLL